MKAMIETYKELIVWQKGIILVTKIYAFTASFPKEEMYSLSSQMRRAAVSIPSNIAEGRSRSSRKDFVQFLRISHGSLAELETQLIVSEELKYGNGMLRKEIFVLINEEKKMLISMISKLKSPSA